jgi:hypothetical protein
MFGLPNARISYAIASSEPTGWDEVTGLPIFGNSTGTITASLEVETDPSIYNLQGVENIICKLAGKIIKPSKMPSKLIAHAFYDLEIDLYGETKTGRFYLLPTPTSRLGVDKVLGQRIEGVMVGTA